MPRLIDPTTTVHIAGPVPIRLGNHVRAVAAALGQRRREMLTEALALYAEKHRGCLAAVDASTYAPSADESADTPGT